VHWARTKIAELVDRHQAGANDDEIRAAVLEVALEHHLMSPYTSLVAVDVTPVRRSDEDLHTHALETNVPDGWDVAIARARCDGRADARDARDGGAPRRGGARHGRPLASVRRAMASALTAKRRGAVVFGLLLGIGAWQLGSAAWIHVKAGLAQLLLQRAWARTLAGEVQCEAVAMGGHVAGGPAACACRTASI
jgi:hypothetical protein